MQVGKFFEAESGGNTGGGTSTDEGKLSGQTTPPAAQTSEQVDAVIKLNPAQLAERLERARTTEREKLLKDLGFESNDAIKAAIEAGKKAQEAQKTEQERQQEALQKAQELAQALEARAKQAEERAQSATLQAEALSLMAGKFANPKAAFRLLDLTGVKVQDGAVTGLVEAVEKLAKDEPWALAQPARKTPQNFTTSPPEGGDPAKESETAKRSRYFGGNGAGDFFKGGGVKIGK